jgi:hypothetical protein
MRFSQVLKADNAWKDKMDIKFQFMKYLADKARKHKGHIFGGYPRDLADHDYAASKFYDSNMPIASYNDPKVLPEFKARLTVANDLDVVFESKEEAMGFIEALMEKKKYSIFTSSNSEYNQRNYNDINFETYYVAFNVPYWMRSKFDSMYIKMDIMYTNTSTPWNQILSKIGNIDFRCNGLVIMPDGNYNVHPDLNLNNNFTKMSPFSRIKFIDRIQDEIVAKRAVSLGNPLDTKRILKMFRKGYTLEGIDSVMTGYDNPVLEDRTCLLCLENFKSNPYPVAIRSCCKSGWLHINCCKQYIEFNKVNNRILTCMLCKEWTTYDDEFLNAF